MGDFSSLLDYIGTQNNLSGLQQWQKEGGLTNDPDLSKLADYAPRTYEQLAPSIIQKQLEQNAINGVYGAQQPAQPQQPQSSALAQYAQGDAQPNAPAPQTLPDPSQQPPDPTQAAQSQVLPGAVNAPAATSTQSSLQKMAGSMAYLPASLQTMVAQQMMMQGMGGSQGSMPQAQAIANYKMAPLTAQQLKSPMGMALQNQVLDLNPDYDATTYAGRKKTEQDMSPGGVLGQKVTQVQTAINHLASLQDASSQLGGVDAGYLSVPINAVRNVFKSSSPALSNYKAFQTLAGDEVAKAAAGSTGSTEADRANSEGNLSPNLSPPARKAAAQADIQALFGKLEPIAAQYNSAYGKNISPVDLLSPETQASLGKLGMLPDNAQVPQSQSALGAVTAPSVSPDIAEAARAELARRKKAK